MAGVRLGYYSRQVRKGTSGRSFPGVRIGAGPADTAATRSSAGMQVTEVRLKPGHYWSIRRRV
jgi:hypothetical protein